MKKFLLGFITGTILMITAVILVINKFIKLFGKFLEITETIDDFKKWLSNAIYVAMYGKPRRDYAKFYSRRRMETPNIQHYLAIFGPFKTRRDAIIVLDNCKEVIDDENIITVEELKYIAHSFVNIVRCNDDNCWCWNDLSSADVIRENDGWYIRTPDVLPVGGDINET